MSLQHVTEYLRQFNAAERIIVLPGSTATVALAAEQLGTEPCRIAKTLAFGAGQRTLVVVAAGDARIDNAKFKARFGFKAKMFSAEDTAERVGHAVGGVCPFGVAPGVEVFLDESLRRFDYVYPACGSSQSSIKLTLPELEQFSGGEWVDVFRVDKTYWELHK